MVNIKISKPVPIEAKILLDLGGQLYLTQYNYQPYPY